VLLTAIVAIAQNATSRASFRVSHPRLPGAVTKVPAWIATNAPFDVARFSEPVPPHKNAAPLYLNKLFEFSSELVICFTEGPERARRSQAAKVRSNRQNDP
jgi:hypothetical protein